MIRSNNVCSIRITYQKFPLLDTQVLSLDIRIKACFNKLIFVHLHTIFMNKHVWIKRKSMAFKNTLLNIQSVHSRHFKCLCYGSWQQQMMCLLTDVCLIREVCLIRNVCILHVWVELTVQWEKNNDRGGCGRGNVVCGHRLYKKVWLPVIRGET